MNAFLNNEKQPASSDSNSSLLKPKTSLGVEDSINIISLTTKEYIASASSQLVDVTVINIDDDETTSGSIDSYVYDTYNIPEGIFHNQHNGRHWVHKMYQNLKTPLKYSTLTKENICIPCCRILYGKPRDSHARKKIVKSSALDNLKKNNEKMYPELIPAKPSIQQEVTKKQDKEKDATSMSMMKFMKPSFKNIRWKVPDGCT